MAPATEHVHVYGSTGEGWAASDNRPDMVSEHQRRWGRVSP